MTSFVYTERKLKRIFLELKSAREFLWSGSAAPYDTITNQVCTCIADIKRMANEYGLSESSGPIVSLDDGISKVQEILKSARNPANDQFLLRAMDDVELWTEIIKEHIEETGLELELKQKSDQLKIDGQLVDWMEINIEKGCIEWGCSQLNTRHAKVVAERVCSVLKQMKERFSSSDVVALKLLALTEGNKTVYPSDAFEGARMREHLKFIIIKEAKGTVRKRDSVRFV